ncbi:alpha/beta fold hydrolase [Amycolatopsis magusensis]|uniref:Pimeloyl-ACP methyl ester carboxylesterase n=1 Tax=Amycolatopsis magusensis TaxID=882444 RepID=A0ABS4PN67_9PSEU|nr:alpha/beta fold hydrolase [Amycolatopsis magusensis]MBP2180842.1 pimeloyl-ACP methyl ester carboxylesterase [Amycolatopsis magusensis]
MPPTTSTGRTPITHVPLTTTPLPPLDAHVAPWPGETESVGGLDLHVRRTPGTDEAVAVYVHGLGGSSTNWTDLSALLAPFAGGIAVDLPGFGFSEPPAEFDFGLNSHAALLAEFIDGLGKGPVHLLGNSMGGAIALLVAARRPDLVRTLTLISPAMPDRRLDYRRLSDPRMALAYLPFVGKRVRQALAALGPEERARQVIKLCFANADAFPAQRLAELAEEHNARAEFAWAAPAMARSTFGIFRAWFSRGPESLWAAAEKVSAPSLVVWGEKDRVISVRRASRTATLMPRARLLVLPRTGHVAQMERPNTVAKAVLAMWERVETGDW